MILPFLPAGADGAAGADGPAPVQYDIVDSPVGRLLLTGALLANDVQALTGLYMLDAGSHSASVQRGWIRREGGFAEAAAQLAGYFGGELTEFDLPLAPCGTRFQLAVWEELARIPYGKTVSYGQIATALGKSLVASRAVGLANGRNPISIILPCHRVIGADGSLTGYGWGLDRKEWLLRHEGALEGADSGSAQPALW